MTIINKIFVGTSNAHKVLEISAILNHELEYNANKKYPEPEENGLTLEANALLKASYYAQLTAMPTIADDTGLFVEVLDNKPGIHTARFAGANATYKDNNDLLLSLLGNNPNRKAKFITVIALFDPKDGTNICVQGILAGNIAYSPRGNNGFGYDPIFIPDEYPNLTLAELSETEKNVISHRRKALDELVKLLK